MFFCLSYYFDTRPGYLFVDQDESVFAAGTVNKKTHSNLLHKLKQLFTIQSRFSKIPCFNPRINFCNRSLHDQENF